MEKEFSAVMLRCSKEEESINEVSVRVVFPIVVSSTSSVVLMIVKNVDSEI